jgi:hypothetical protein
MGMTEAEEVSAIPASYKAWVFGSKLAGVLVFAVGIEMMARGEPLWAGLLLLAGAAVVLAPVRSPDRWNASDGRRG